MVYAWIEPPQPPRQVSVIEWRQKVLRRSDWNGR